MITPRRSSVLVTLGLPRGAVRFESDRSVYESNEYPGGQLSAYKYGLPSVMTTAVLLASCTPLSVTDGMVRRVE